ncbi:MAG: DUF3800 domain-containing protein [Thermoleophilia bacterium]|nr:DUF3800 domain-containing protein [Thermoleophilia bacterium]
MYLLFLDESGKPDDGVFALGGVSIRADRWHGIRERWNDCLTQAGWPIDRELKWSGTRDGEVPPEVADAAYACLAELEVECFVTVLWPDTTGYEQFFADDETTYATAITFIAERFNRSLANRDSYGAIVLDSRRSDEDNRMRRFFTDIQNEGTRFADLDRIVDGLMLGPSHFSLGLQLADLVVGCTRAAQLKVGDGSRYHRQLLPRFARNPASGEVEGVGLKLFPFNEKPTGGSTDRLFNPREPDQD